MSAGSALLLDLREAGATMRLTAGTVGPELRLRGASPALPDRVRACKPELLTLLTIPASDVEPTPNHQPMRPMIPTPIAPSCFSSTRPWPPWHEGVTRLQAMPPPAGFTPGR